MQQRFVDLDLIKHLRDPQFQGNQSYPQITPIYTDLGSTGGPRVGVDGSPKRG